MCCALQHTEVKGQPEPDGDKAARDQLLTRDLHACALPPLATVQRPQARAFCVQHRAVKEGHKRIARVAQRHCAEGSGGLVCPGQRGADLVVRGGIEPPAFRFSGGNNPSLRRR